MKSSSNIIKKSVQIDVIFKKEELSDTESFISSSNHCELKQSICEVVKNLIDRFDSHPPSISEKKNQKKMMDCFPCNIRAI